MWINFLYDYVLLSFMNMSMIPSQRPEQRLEQRKLPIDVIVNLWNSDNTLHQQVVRSLEDYFSPEKAHKLNSAFANYLKGEIHNARRGFLNSNHYVSLVLSFQFTAPLLNLIDYKNENGEITAARDEFYTILKRKYDIIGQPYMMFKRDNTFDSEKIIDESEAMKIYGSDLNENFNGKRDVKDSVHMRLKKDGIDSVKLWLHERKKCISDFTWGGALALSEAFGRSIVIPSFFLYKDAKLFDFYKKSADGITYYIAIPESIE